MKLEFGQRADLADIRRIGISRALLYYRYGMAWRTFFTELELEVVLDAPSDRGTLEVGDRLSVDECCLASKLFLGHVSALVDQGVDAVFVLSLMGYGRFDTFCTKFQALPNLAENAFIVAGRRVRVVSFRIDELAGEAEEAAYLGLAARFGVTRKEARRAYKAAIAAQRDYDDAMARGDYVAYCKKVVNPNLSIPHGVKNLLGVYRMVEHIDTFRDRYLANAGFETEPGSFARVRKEFLSAMNAAKTNGDIEDGFRRAMDALDALPTEPGAPSGRRGGGVRRDSAHLR